MSIQVNDTIVLKNNLTGTIRYIGPVEGRAEEWVGIELDEPRGSNNGTVNGLRYFYCRENHGLFVKYQKLTRKITSIEEEGGRRGVSRGSAGEGTKAADLSIAIPRPIDIKTKETLLFAEKDESPASDRDAALAARCAASLAMIQECLETLQKKVDEINRRYKTRTPVDVDEREVLIGLVSGMIQMERKGNKEGMMELLGRFKEIMAKHKIRVD